MRNAEVKNAAKIIGELSGGTIAIEIYNSNDDLIYSHDYFRNGASDTYYKQVLRQVIDDCLACDDATSWDGCEYDDDGDILSQNSYSTNYIFCEYSKGVFSFSEPQNDMCSDIIKANKDRLPANSKNLQAWVDEFDL